MPRARQPGPALGDDARALAGSHFGPMDLTGRLSIADPSRITARAQAALDELVTAGVIAFEVHEEGIDYRPLVDCTAHMRWMRRNLGKGRFSMMEPERPGTPPSP